MLCAWRCNPKAIELWESVVDLPPNTFGTNECMKLGFDGEWLIDETSANPDDIWQ
jgi:hypothetical protein